MPRPRPLAALATWAAHLRYESLPVEVVRHVRRVLLDALACALGGLRRAETGAARAVLDEIAAPGPATIVGSGRRVDPVSAAFANSLAVRALDYNDIYWKQDPVHPSDLIPAALAAGERARADGRALVVGIALAYELTMRLAETATPGIRERGFHHATYAAIVAPMVAGRMIGLDAERIERAVGIGASCHVSLGAVAAGALTWMKGAADPLAVRRGMLAALLAERGLGGPDLLAGKEGLVDVLGPGWDLAGLVEALGARWRIGECTLKAFPSEALTHAPISAVLDLAQHHGLAAEEVERVEVRTSTRAADILGDPSKYDPRTAETADHSLPFVLAAALARGRVGPAEFEETGLTDATIRALLPRVVVTADAEIDRLFPGRQRAVVSVLTRDGRRLAAVRDYPRGDPREPLSDREIEDKLHALAEPLLDAAARQRIIDAVWGVERLESISDLTDRLRLER